MTLNEVYVSVANFAVVVINSGMAPYLVAYFLWNRWVAPEWRKCNGVKDIAFLAAKSVAIVAVCLGIARVWTSAVDAEMAKVTNSDSTQAVLDAGNQISYKLDQLIGWEPSDGGSTGDGMQQASMLAPLGGGQKTQNAQYTAPDGKTYEVTLPDPSAADYVPAGVIPGPLLGEPQAIPVPTMAPIEQVNLVGTQYTVLPGSSLSEIAEIAYGSADGWRDIYAANASMIGSDPSRISAGMRLVIPERGSQQVTFIATNAPAPKAPAAAPSGLASDGRVYYDVAIPTPVPAFMVVEAYPGQSKRVTTIQPVQPVVVAPTPTATAKAPTYVAAVQPTPAPTLDLWRPQVDTSVAGIGASSSNSGTTMTIGN